MAELIMKTNIFDVDFEKGTLRPREAVQLVQYDNKTNKTNIPAAGAIKK